MIFKLYLKHFVTYVLKLVKYAKAIMIIQKNDADSPLMSSRWLKFKHTTSQQTQVRKYTLENYVL